MTGDVDFRCAKCLELVDAVCMYGHCGGCCLES